MREKITRRRALGTIAGAVLTALRPPSLRAQTADLEYQPSSLTDKQLEAQKMKAVNELISGFWKFPQIRAHITRFFFRGSRNQNDVRRQLHAESRMYIPTKETIGDLQKKYQGKLAELANAIPDGQT